MEHSNEMYFGDFLIVFILSKILTRYINLYVRFQKFLDAFVIRYFLNSSKSVEYYLVFHFFLTYKKLIKVDW